MPDGAGCVIDGRTGGLRRQVGPQVWAVLEEAALSVEGSSGDASLWCRLSVRTVAARLGIGREAVGCALRALMAAGMPRRDTGGRSPDVGS